MDQFAPLELSKRLHRLGCVSSAGFYYEEVSGSFAYGPRFCSPDAKFEQRAEPEYRKYVPAFHVSDFLSPSEQSRDNCRKIWPLKCKRESRRECHKCGFLAMYSEGSCWENFRHRAIEVPNIEVFWEILDVTAVAK